MKRHVMLIVAFIVGTVVLLTPWIPLGIPGEWEWTRQTLPQDLSEWLDRLLVPMIAGLVVAGYCRYGEKRIGECSRGMRILLLLLLAGAGFLWQQAARQAAASPHRELRPLWILYDKYASGYFYEAAFVMQSPRELLAGYEARMAEGDVLHEGTHPPGLFLLSQWALLATRSSESLARFSEFMQSAETIRLFRSAEAQAGMARALSGPELSALCLISWMSSLLAAMTVLPVYGIMAHLQNRRVAWRAACLIITIPSVTVFTPRSDVVYTLTGTVLIWLFLKAISGTSGRHRLWYAIGAGFWSGICLTISLAHLPIFFAMALFSGAVWIQSLSSERRQVVAALCTMLLMFGIFIVVFRVLTDCHLPDVWRWNLKNHAGFYGTSPRTWWKWLLENPLELAFSAGLPLTLAGLKAVTDLLKSEAWKHFLMRDERDDQALPAGSKDQRADRELSAESVLAVSRSGAVLPLALRPTAAGSLFPAFSVSLIITWAVLWMSGKNMGESARLWCFLTPWIVMITAGQWSRETGRRSGEKRSFQRKPEAAYDTFGWIWLLLSQLAIGIVTTGRVSGYSLLDMAP